MTESTLNSHTRFGTMGGLLTVLFVNVTGEEVLKTAILAAIGASVSFLVSWSIKYLLRRVSRFQKN